MNTKKKGAQTASTAASQLLRPAAGFGSAFGAAPNPAQTLSQALNLHQRGDLTGAERLYRQVLRVRAEDPNALNMLGVSPSDLVAILEALKQAGALKAEMVVI